MVRPDQSARSWAAVGTVLFVAVFGGFYYLLIRPEWGDKAIVAIEGASESSQLLVTVAHESCSARRPKVYVDTAAPTSSTAPSTAIRATAAADVRPGPPRRVSHIVSI